VIFTHQNLTSSLLTYLVHAKSTAELISFEFSNCSVRSLVSANRCPNEKWLHFLADLRSQSKLRTQRMSQRKTNPNSEM